jgi:Helix-turn-helix.
MMKLAAWMAKSKTDDDELAAQVNVDRVTINRLKRGVNMPSWPLMVRLADATKRKVMPNDFLDTARDKS